MNDDVFKNFLGLAVEAAKLIATDTDPGPGKLEPHDSAAVTMIIASRAYGWTMDHTGRVYGLISGDMGYAATSIVVDQQMERVRHVARGSFYDIVAEGAELQTAAPIAEGEKLTIYRGDDGHIWARPDSEFRDGRFEPADPDDRPVTAFFMSEPAKKDVAVLVDALHDLLTRPTDGAARVRARDAIAWADSVGISLDRLKAKGPAAP